MKTIAFFNNKGGVGKTSLVYHLAAMYADLGYSVVAADFDPQANLSSMFLDEDSLEALWSDPDHAVTVQGALRPLLAGTGDVSQVNVVDVGPRVGLVVGDLKLALSESELSRQWPEASDGHERAFRVLSAFWRIVEDAVQQREAAVALIDVGPNLGAINRAALIAAEYVVIPLAPDLFSIQGLRNLGPTLVTWRSEWNERLKRKPIRGLSLPTGKMAAAGYVVLQHAMRLDRPVKAYEKWMARIPGVYREAVLQETSTDTPTTVSEDAHCLASLKHYRSLMPLAQEARKPMFHLRPADGAIGSHARAVQSCYGDFRALAEGIALRCRFSRGLPGTLPFSP